MMNVMLVLFLVLSVELGSGSPPIYRSRSNPPVQRRSENVPLSAQKSNEVPVQTVPEGVLGQRLKDVPVKTPLVRPDQRIHSVFVSCFPSSMEIKVEADLFHTGYRVDPADLKVGTGEAWCGVTTANTDHFIIQVPLTDCGTQYQVTADALIYYNLLVYSPPPSPDGMVRMEEENIPVQCRYSRRFGVDSEPVTPTWLSHRNVQSAQQTLYFTLRLMNSDWQTERGSGAYFLGDVINMEASVFVPQMDMRVYVESCVATVTAEVNSLPRYKFIDNGCFVDGQQMGSRSLFLPRKHPDKLQLQLSVFVFNQINSPQIFISCVLRANMLSSDTSRACSFIHKSWRSADGHDGACALCASRNEPAQVPQGPRPSLPPNQNQRGSVQPLKKHHEALRGSVLREPGVPLTRTAGSMWGGVVAPMSANSVEGLQQDASIGPLSLTTWLNNGGVMSPPIVRRGGLISHSPSFKSNRKRGNLSAQTDSTTETMSTTEASLVSDAWMTQVSAATDTEGSAFPETELIESRVTFTSPESALTNQTFATRALITEGLQQDESLDLLSPTSWMNKGGVMSPPLVKQGVHISHIPSFGSNWKTGNVSDWTASLTDPANEVTSTTEESPITDVWTTKVSSTTDTEGSVVPQTLLTDTWVTTSTPDLALTNDTFATPPSIMEGAATLLPQNSTSTESAVPLWDPPERAAADDYDAPPVSLTEYAMVTSTIAESEMESSEANEHSIHHLGLDPVCEAMDCQFEK